MKIRGTTGTALAFTLIMAAAVAACGLIGGSEDASQEAAGQEKKQQFTEDGRPLIELSINGPQEYIRSLNPAANADADAAAGGPAGPDGALFLELAKTFNFYEVIFKNGSQFYTKSIRLPNAGKIALPPGTYAAGTDSIMLAGIYGDEPQLLAIGVTAASVSITPTTQSIAFTMHAITSDVGGAATNVTVTAPTGVSRLYANINGDQVPYWTGITIGGTDTTLTGKIKLSLSGSPTDGWKGLVLPTGVAGTGVPPKPVVHFVPLNVLSGATSTLGVTEGTGGIVPETAFTSFTALPATGNDWDVEIIKGTVKANIAPGLTMFSYDIPVKGLDGGTYDSNKLPTTNKAALLWHIKNGLQNAAADRGANTETGTGNDLKSTGGALILEIGSAGITNIPITVGW